MIEPTTTGDYWAAYLVAVMTSGQPVAHATSAAAARRQGQALADAQRMARTTTTR